MERLLAEQKEAPLYYTVFSVVICTLCIVLVVEVIRHQLDVAASGNPFFQTVLELMYRELTTLGLVEVVIHLLHVNLAKINYAMEDVFVDVHFMLFYTAMLNALQSCLVHMITSRRTDKAWIQNEDIDIGHYVAIRKELDRVEHDWMQVQYSSGINDAYVRSTSFRHSSEGNQQDLDRLSLLDSCWSYIHDLLLKLRHPRLYLRKRKLLVLVRYHELRRHFIEQNGLSSNFKVSQYLKRSLTSVLSDFVHISAAAWVMLMALGILLYYISGILVNVSDGNSLVSEFLTWTLASGIILFIVISICLFVKMRSIFEKILHMKLTVEDENTGTRTSFHGFRWSWFDATSTTRRNSYDQINLFWGGNPHLIIVLTQFMQFGFALGLAAFITYWDAFEHYRHRVEEILALILLYGFFLHILADILPWFTLCTSLGQLVNKERLHETMAELKLTEELRKAEAVAEAAAFEKEVSSRQKKGGEGLHDRVLTSVNDESDIDDLPDIVRSIVARKKIIENIDLAMFFQGYRYKSLSLFFGPLFCSFLVAMRVDGFNIVEENIEDYKNTFNFPLTTGFWLEVVWYCLMFTEQFVAFLVFAKKRNSKEILAPVVGALIVVTCLVLLIAAETKRCCLPDESDEVLRQLSSFEQRSTAEEYTGYTKGEGTGCCSAFGTRTFGGLGNIEPYTFLMALAPLRFSAAGLFGMNTEDEVTHNFDDSHDNHYGSDPDEVRNIWLTTIGQHCDVAKKYGLFSVQILYCMLGLDISVHDLDNSTLLESAPESVGTSKTTPSPKNSLAIFFDKSIFAFPDSKLIRRMRRCERRLLPLLDTWMLVDVVLTSHELVILEVPEDDNISSPSNIVGSCGAISLGGGCKGLRLNEVVQGRKVVQKFMLDDIDCIAIEHSLSIPGDVEIRDIESNCQQLGEFWQGSSETMTYVHADMSKRWCSVDEDRLKVHFTSGCGTLYLRFLVDLKEKEVGRNSLPSFDDSYALLANVGTETKLWCSTIARQCGVDQLKMNLPHFGNNTGDAEIADFIKVTERDRGRNLKRSFGVRVLEG